MIRVRALTKRYGSRTAVENVSFEVRDSEVFGLLGPNGAGKTTTLSMLSTLLKPDAGEIWIGDLDLRRYADQARALIGLVPQELALYPALSAWDNVAFFGRIYGLEGAALKARVEAVLDAVGLRDRAKDPVRTFSGGMKRRLNLAIGLVHAPRVLLLDEPTVGVDPQSRNFIFEHILRLKQEGMTLIYTTHYMEEAERLCDRVAIMDEGRILAIDTPQALIELLGGGVIHLVAPDERVGELCDAARALPHVRTASAQGQRLKLETHQANAALLETIALCNDHHVPILALEVLEPNLESVFLHLTGKRLRE